MRRETMWKAVISGLLVLTLAVTGITLYSTGKEDESKEKQNNKAQLVENTEDKNLKDDSFDSQDVSNGSVKAENYENHENNNKDEVKSNDKTNEEDKDTSGEVLAELNFNEDSEMVWPVKGKILIDYSMETTTYFPTLNQYKCCNGVVIGAEVGTAVQAAANGTIVSIWEHEETGMTVSMDLGNGYRAIYGQLKGLRAKVGDTIVQGEIFGYVEEPTKYFVKEGANLYFSMKKDGMYVDPMMYLEMVIE